MKIEVKGRIKGTELISSIIWEDKKISTDENIMVLLEMQDKLNTCVKLGPYEDYCSNEDECGAVGKVKAIYEAREEKVLSEMREFIDEVMSQTDPERAVSDDLLDKKLEGLTQKWNQCKGGNLMDKIFTPQEVAEYLKIKEKTVKDYLREGKLGGFKTGKEWRVRERDIVEFMNSGGVKPKYHKKEQ